MQHGNKNDNSSAIINAIPSNKGQNSISGSETTPEADDDTLAAAHAVGEQLAEDEQHPKPVDIGRDINNAEEDIRTH